MNKLISWLKAQNTYIQLLPFLFLYIAIVIFWKLPANMCGDEGRYIMFANNLLNGFYSPPAPNFNLWNGPGYPIFITPFVFLKFPYLAIRILNAFLLYFSLVICYKTVALYATRRVSLLTSILIGLYMPEYQALRLMISEMLAFFLIAALSFSLIKYLNDKNGNKKYLFSTAIVIAYLCMVKAIFGYVLLVVFLIQVLFYLSKKYRNQAKKSIYVLGLSLIFCLPYLFYTYNVTGKFFYWTNSGSMSLYTMSSPYEGELGDWFSSKELKVNPNHKLFMDSIASFNSLDEELAFKNQAIVNIKNHPFKFSTNWISNVSRLLFDYPFTNYKQTFTTIFYIFPSMFVVVLIFLASFFFVKYLRSLDFAIILLLLFFIIYLSASSLVSAYNRMFFITIPFWGVFVSYIFYHFVHIGEKK